MKCKRSPIAPLPAAATAKISPQRDFPLTAASATYFSNQNKAGVTGGNWKSHGISRTIAACGSSAGP
ncbi:hypothetical protein, partial [Mesorhizobium sp. M2A.F.Ca.ET.039.01.1.1]|uniref:hypothetical protein n=1 Tax=Mesorhizobium sp. M2A.F.Ca.ET.039.01.1.1 TaxID=2496746 RepID=UPI001AED11A3